MDPGFSESLAAFSDYYRPFYPDTWDQVLHGLLQEPPGFYRVNRWCQPDTHSTTSIPSAEIRDSRGICQYFLMDPASAHVPGFLNVSPGQKVLDMCAAPGGKSLILWELMQAQGELILNDLSSARRHRLRAVLHNFIPESHMAGIRIIGVDATRIGLTHPAQFDRILLDAPCSSEAHILRSTKAMSQWSPARSRQLIHRQFSLLCSALSALKPGGILVYSTCSISPDENDGVVKKILKRAKHRCELLKISSDLGYQTETGYLVLPHLHHAGPMFFSALQKGPLSI